MLKNFENWQKLESLQIDTCVNGTLKSNNAKSDFVNSAMFTVFVIFEFQEIVSINFPGKCLGWQ